MRREETVYLSHNDVRQATLDYCEKQKIKLPEGAREFFFFVDGETHKEWIEENLVKDLVVIK